ncbi:hypothetical protein Tco_0524230 [Tanacetum coccineum]
MAISIADQIALDDALVAPADRLKIGKCNLRLSSDVTSKEATLQVVYDVLKLTPFYKAFQVTADAPEIYMQEFWASAYVHNRSVRFKMNNKKHIIGLEQFRDILQICPKVGNKKFVEPPLEKEILIFLASLGHSGDIRKITDSSSFSSSKFMGGSGADEGTGVTPGGSRLASLIMTQRMISLGNQVMMIQVDEQDQDDEDAGKNDVNETTQDDEDDDDHDDDEKVQYDREHEKNSNKDEEGTNVEGAKLDEEDTYEEDQEMKKLERHLCGPPNSVNPEVNNRGSSCMDQDSSTKHTFMSLPFLHKSMPSNSTEALEENSQNSGKPSICEALSSIPKKPPHPPLIYYLANKMQEAVDVAVQLKYDRIREESTTANQQFLDSIDDGLTEIIRNKSKEGLQKIIPKSRIPGVRTSVQDEQAEEEVQHLPDWFQQPTRLPSPDHAWNKYVPAVHESVQPWSTFELMKGTLPRSLTELEYFCESVPNSQGRRVIPFHHFINNDLEYLRGGVSSRKYSTSVTKTTAADYGHIKWIEDLVPNSMGISSGRLFKKRIIAVTKVEIVEWHDYKHLDWITVIQRRVEDLQLGVESYQKKLNLTKPDTYRSNLRRQDAYTPYSDPRGFIYENKDKKNRLMRIDELHKFSDGTLDDVRTALNDRLKGIRMEYLPQTFWSQRDKANARAMIQAIDKRLKTRRIMRSLERFVGGRPYGGRLKRRKVSKRELCRPEMELHWYNPQGVSMSLEYTQVLSDIVGQSMGPSDAMINPLQHTQSQKDFVSKLTGLHSFLLTFSLRNMSEFIQHEMEILLEPTSNKLMVEHAEYDESNTYVLERFNTTAGNHVKKILLKLNLSDHRLCKMVVECQSVKVKEFQERCNIKAFQEWYEHVGPEVASPQDGKVTRWRRDCAWLMISRCSRSQCQIQVQGTSSIQEVNDHYNIFTRESQEYELKSKDKA